MNEEFGTRGAEISWTDEQTACWTNGVLEAGSPYFPFLFGDAGRAKLVLASWLSRASSEVARERSWVYLQQGRILGGFILLSSAELVECRRADLMALVRGGDHLPPRRVLQERLEESRELFSVPGAGEYYLSKLWVHPGNRGQGIGRRILSEVTDQARRLGAGAVTLDVWAGNSQAIALYRRVGYRERSATMSPAGMEYISMTHTPPSD